MKWIKHYQEFNSRQECLARQVVPVVEAYNFKFPAVRGIQGGREYYVCMCPLNIISKIFAFNEEAALSPEARAQRVLNKSRVPEIARYITENPDGYVFSALTASVDTSDSPGSVSFEPVSVSEEGHSHAETADQMGTLTIPMSARFIINDGQHRRAAIEEALKEKPGLAVESIAVVFFLDERLERSQQMFADLNRHVIRPSKSIGVLYDHRDEMAYISRLVALKSEAFSGLVDLERSSLSHRSRKLFTLSAIFQATKRLLDGLSFESKEDAADLAIKFWDEVARRIPEWGGVKAGALTSGRVRKDYIHSQGLALHALGKMGNALLEGEETAWADRLDALLNIDWKRSNAKVWEGRALVGGNVQRGSQNILLTTSYLKSVLGLELTEEEEKAEAHKALQLES